MSHYTKLWSSIITSTVWREPLPTKVCWITMLALADAGGNVEASVPGLAHAAGITIEECEAALQRFRDPDTYSRTQEHEGRRIKDIDGGWFIYTYEKHRQGADAEMRRAKNREAQRAWRERRRAAASKDDSNGVSDDVGAETPYVDQAVSRSTKQKKEKASPQTDAGGVDNSADAFRLAPYLDAYQERFPGSAVPAARFGKSLKALEAKHGADETLRRWMVFLEAKGELGPEYFARTWSEWNSEAGSGMGDDAAEVAWQGAVYAFLPMWRERRWSSEQHAELDAPMKAGLSKIGGFRPIHEADEIGRKGLRKQFIAAYRAASNGGK